MVSASSINHHAKFGEDRTMCAGCTCENVMFVFCHTPSPEHHAFEGCIVQSIKYLFNKSCINRCSQVCPHSMVKLSSLFCSFCLSCHRFHSWMKSVRACACACACACKEWRLHWFILQRRSTWWNTPHRTVTLWMNHQTIISILCYRIFSHLHSVARFDLLLLHWTKLLFPFSSLTLLVWWQGKGIWRALDVNLLVVMFDWSLYIL